MNITEELLLQSIEDTRSRISKLREFKSYVHREYYNNDSISYHLEEDAHDIIQKQLDIHELRIETFENILDYMNGERSDILSWVSIPQSLISRFSDEQAEKIMSILTQST